MPEKQRVDRMLHDEAALLDTTGAALWGDLLLSLEFAGPGKVGKEVLGATLDGAQMAAARQVDLNTDWNPNPDLDANLNLFTGDLDSFASYNDFGLSEPSLHFDLFESDVIGGYDYDVWVGGLVADNVGSPSELAKSFQGSDPYFGVDNFRDITLKKGTFITSGVHSPELDDLSGFFTTQSGLNRALTDGVVDANKFNQGLQIFSARPQYRPGVTVFEVLEDTPAAFGLTKANPKFSPGGYKSLPQIYIPEFESILKPIKSIPAINKKAPKYD